MSGGEHSQGEGREALSPLAAYISNSIKNDPDGPIAQAVRKSIVAVLDFGREWERLEREARGEVSS